MDASIWTYPWDLHDEGVEHALRDIRDEGGLNAISLAANYHTTKCLLPHNPRRKVFFSESGALYFRPRIERYGRIKPPVSDLAQEADVWGEAARAGEALGIRLKAWLIGNHSTALGKAYPDCTVRNAFGDTYYPSLCPSAPDVRAYLVALIGDLTAQYPLGAVELKSVGYMRFEHEFHHEKTGIHLDAWHDFLLSLCFCDHCTAAAAQRGIDTEAVRDMVRCTLTAFFESDLPVSTVDHSMLQATSLALHDDDFRGYLAMRLEVVTSLVEALKEAVSAHSPSTRILCFADPIGSWKQGIDLKALHTIADGFITTYAPTGKEMVALIRRLRMILGENADLVAAIKATYPHTVQAADVTGRNYACRGIGVRAFNFYNYGLMRKSGLTAIRQAFG